MGERGCDGHSSRTVDFKLNSYSVVSGNSVFGQGPSSDRLSDPFRATLPRRPTGVDEIDKLLVHRHVQAAHRRCRCDSYAPLGEETKHE